MVRCSGFNTSLVEMLAAWKSQISTAFSDQSNRMSDLTVGPPSTGLSAVLKAVLTAGLYPHVARTEYVAPVDVAVNPVRRACTVQTVQGDAQVHPSSVNRFLATNGWLVYHEKVILTNGVINNPLYNVTSCYAELVQLCAP